MTFTTGSAEALTFRQRKNKAMKALANFICWLSAIAVHFFQVIYSLVVPLDRNKGLMTKPESNKTSSVAYNAKAWMYRMFASWHVDSYAIN